jgi:hypothetical protein
MNNFCNGCRHAGRDYREMPGGTRYYYCKKTRRLVRDNNTCEMYKERINK